MKKIIFALICISFVGVISCKKDKTEPAPINNTPSTPPVDGSPSFATNFYGIFTSGMYHSVVSNTIAPVGYVLAKAYFSNQPTAYINSSTAVMVNKVFINADTLTYNSGSKYYNINTLLNLGAETWSVNGANGIGSFSISINPITPSIDLPYNFPDSVSKSAGFSFSINNVANAGKANLLILDGTNSVNGAVSKPLTNGNNTVTFSASDLANLTTTNNGYLAVILSTSKGFVFSSKDFQFNRDAQYTKYIKIKP